MDTTYYSFETRKVKVSGGADLAVLVPAAVTAPASPAGEVLDFDRCRRKLETKAAWKGLAKAAAEVKFQAAGDDAHEEAAVGGDLNRPAPAATSVERPAPARPRRTPAPMKAVSPVGRTSPEKRPRKSACTPRTERGGSWLELCASVAVILTCVCAGWGFLALV